MESIGWEDERLVKKMIFLGDGWRLKKGLPSFKQILQFLNIETYKKHNSHYIPKNISA